MHCRAWRIGTICLLVVATTWLSPMVTAGEVGKSKEFVERPGVHEFSGHMIARPAQNSATRSDAARHRIEANYTILHYYPETDWYVIDIPAGQNENGVARTLMATNDFEFVEPDWVCYPAVTPDDTHFAEQWALEKIQAEAAWEYNTGFNGVTVGICDTGLRTTHLDLSSLRKQGYNAVDDVWENLGGNVDDIQGHGTYTTGIATAQGNNARGISGVGWNFAHRILKVSNEANGGTTISVLTHAAIFSSEQGDRVVSVSYSGVDDPVVRAAAATVRSNGSLLIWAAGNDGIPMDTSQRDDDDVVVVGATDPSDARPRFSNYGLYVDLFAPGSSILSLSNQGDDDYISHSGTSAATPFVSGLAALIWSQNPSFTPDEVEALLKATCDNVGDSDVFGYGRINAARALENCGRHSLGSTWQGGNAQNGAMFDLTCLNPNGITITALDFNNLTSGNANLEVYYVTDKTSFVGKESNAAAWTMLGSQTSLPAQPEGRPTGINIGGLNIEYGQTIGLYVTRTDGGYIRYTNGPLGSYSTADLRWEDRGMGVVYPFGAHYNKRVFNGSVHYRVNVGGILPTTGHAANNFIPFARNDSCVMQQVFNKNLFSSPVFMESIGFAPNPSIVGETATAKHIIRMGYTNKIPGASTSAGGLDAVLANNPAGSMTTLFSSSSLTRTFTGNGSIEHSMFFDFGENTFLYNPELGNLLVEITSVNNSAVDIGVSRASGGGESSRAYNSARFGNVASPTTATRMDLGWRPATAGFTMTASGTCPGLVTVSWEHATPNSRIGLFFAGDRVGHFTIPSGPCEGATLGLGGHDVRLITTFPSGTDGGGTRTWQAQPGACRGWMQMHDLANCNHSNVVQHP